MAQSTGFTSFRPGCLPNDWSPLWSVVGFEKESKVVLASLPPPSATPNLAGGVHALPTTRWGRSAIAIRQSEPSWASLPKAGRRPAAVRPLGSMSGMSSPDRPSPGRDGCGLVGCQNSVWPDRRKLWRWLTLQIGFICEKTLFAAQLFSVPARPAVIIVYADFWCICGLRFSGRGHCFGCFC